MARLLLLLHCFSVFQAGLQPLDQMQQAVPSRLTSALFCPKDKQPRPDVQRETTEKCSIAQETTEISGKQNKNHIWSGE